jgi:hypothetical protein
VQSLHLHSQAITVHKVIGVHACDETATTVPYTRVQSGDKTLMRHGDYLKARVLVSELLRVCPGGIPGAVVNNDTLPPLFGLP